jgi:hypothetical protein
MLYVFVQTRHGLHYYNHYHYRIDIFSLAYLQKLTYLFGYIGSFLDK